LKDRDIFLIFITKISMAKTKEKQEGKSSIDAVLEKLNKTYGIGTVVTLDSKTSGDYDLISTGSIGFDHITLGVGGFVKGRLYELMGWEGSGKSTICGHAAANCQANGGKVLYIDGEHALDKKYFEALGVNTSEMLIAQPSCGEEGFNIAIDMINTGEIDLVIIDSDSSLIPKRVVDGDVGDSSIGYKARLNSSVYPKMKSALSKNNTCVIVVSQYREKIGVMFGNPTTTQGGHALKFYSDVRIEVTKSLAKEGDVVYANTTKVKAVKNKMASPYKSAKFDIVYGKGIAKLSEVLELGNEYEVIKKWGKTITFNETKYDLEQFTELIEDNPEFYNQLVESIVSKIMNTEIKPEENVESEI
jgi:recombination protein RecA